MKIKKFSPNFVIGGMIFKISYPLKDKLEKFTNQQNIWYANPLFGIFSARNFVIRINVIKLK